MISGPPDQECKVQWAQWSPDGEWIVYNADYDGDPEIFLRRVGERDFEEEIQLPDNEDNDGMPRWRPL